MNTRTCCKRGLLFIVLLVMGAGSVCARIMPDQSTWFVDMKRFSQAAHTGLSCEACHGTMKEDGRLHPDPERPDFLQSAAKRVYDYARCKKCHAKAYERYLAGEHATAMEKTPQDAIKTYAPTCGDCHSSHYDPAHLSRVEIGKRMTEVCGVCHVAQKESYLENYHGKAAVNLGYDKAAYCTDCHGAHTCKSLKNDKTVALNVCHRCHPKASEDFTEFVIHYDEKGIAEKDDEKNRYVSRIHLVSALSLIFVILMLCAFYSHTFLLMLRKIHEKLRRHDGE